MPPKGKTPGCSGCGDCKKIGDKSRSDGTCGLAKCIENLKLNDPELQAAFVKALKESKLPLAHTFLAAIKKQRLKISRLLRLLMQPRHWRSSRLSPSSALPR